MAWWVGCIINIFGSISINLGTVRVGSVPSFDHRDGILTVCTRVGTLQD